jgi:predicted Zn-dependent protease
VPFSRLETGSLARSLARITDQEDDHGDIFFERSEVVELPADDEGPGILARREQGFAVRLLREGITWLASRDEIDPESFRLAMREVARALPGTTYAPLALEVAPFDEEFECSELHDFATRVRDGIREEHVAFPLRLGLRRYRRWIQVVGNRLVPAPEFERFYSCTAEMPWGRFGTLLAVLDEEAAEVVAGALIESFGSRDANSPAVGSGLFILGPAATAVLLHEAVAHPLEVDTLVLGGRPEAACGHQLGSELLNVLDDPEGCPEGLRRSTDDEGMRVIRRWLLQQGRIREPLADVFHAAASPLLSPGAARRADRHAAPVPRSTHLELLPGESTWEDLLSEAETGLYLPEAQRGRLDPISGEFELHFPFGRRVVAGEPADYVGPSRLRGQVAELLTAITAVGAETRFAGAGWCAKGGQRLPVWASCPPVRVEGLELES